LWAGGRGGRSKGKRVFGNEKKGGGILVGGKGEVGSCNREGGFGGHIRGAVFRGKIGPGNRKNFAGSALGKGVTVAHQKGRRPEMGLGKLPPGRNQTSQQRKGTSRVFFREKVGPVWRKKELPL